MKFCYVDESGTGSESYAVMVGVIVDALRMRPTKADWDALLRRLEDIIERPLEEIHTRDFYAGNTPWRGIDGKQRARFIGSILDWIGDRKHSIVYCAVDKQKFYSDFDQDPRFKDVQTLWRFMGLHLTLAIQKAHQSQTKNKGNTVLIFDNEERECTRFTDMILNPPAWTDSYYSRGRKQDALDQIIDAPYFADSRDVPMLQVADFTVFFLRRHVELQSGDTERYAGEKELVAEWAAKIFERSVSSAAIYPKRARCECADMFYRYAPAALLG